MFTKTTIHYSKRKIQEILQTAEESLKIILSAKEKSTQKELKAFLRSKMRSISTDSQISYIAC